MISPGAFADDKAMSMRTIRHEMLHVRHRQITLAAATKWDADGRKKPFGTWVAKHAKRLKLSAADVILVQQGAQGGQVNTEVLSYVEGFMTELHLSPPTKAGTLMAFFELLGAASNVEVPDAVVAGPRHGEGQGAGAPARLLRHARRRPPPAVEAVGRRGRRQVPG